ncbi:hypothetical protein Igag_0825 [Ignisphaera aggregans DSM 17230]|uniref:Uncharacterized protein n=1 Tax=Ignisphaera aggregans (strain DSM 17230 / JCM 13409 / AQ1.S1) TaxID=583356 RepID=E0STN2_IGNAA|nr:hypothetical protein Igag_0825 [Ignisphaera aggregans DSM 17230]
MNRVFVVESFVYRITREGYQPSEEELMGYGALLGQPTRKLSAFLDRYRQVFGYQIERRCSSVGDERICIYTWSQRHSFKLFPLSLHAFGTIIRFRDDKPVDVLAYPMPKALSYAKSPGLSEKEYGDRIPREVTERVDGWQLTAYYNPILGRWIFATRYVLHNMYFERGRLVEEDFSSIANPYIYVADRLADEFNLYQILDRYRGWTFTFVLLGPEPAITRPPYPMGSDYKLYRLIPLFARDSSGKLYSWSETEKLLGLEGPRRIGSRRLSELYEEVRRRLDVRSYIAFIDTDDPENPVIAELESDYYPDAMMVKHLYSAKSTAILICEGFLDELKRIVDRDTLDRVERFALEVQRFIDVLQRARDIDAVSEKISSVVKELRGVEIRGEISKSLREGNIKRVAKKVLGTLLEDKSLRSEEIFDIVARLIKEIESL